MTRETRTVRFKANPAMPWHEAEHEAWLSMCDEIYGGGLRLVPPSEGGAHGTFAPDPDDDDCLVATVVVEPLALRPVYRTVTNDEPEGVRAAADPMRRKASQRDLRCERCGAVCHGPVGLGVHMQRTHGVRGCAGGRR